MSKEHYYGAKVAKNFRYAKVWVFRAKDKRLLGTITRKMNPGLTLEVRREDIEKFLTPYGIKP